MLNHIKNKTINVLSLFDGCAGARQALKELNVDCTYYASEVDKYAIQIAMKNHPDIIQLGDVRGVKAKDLPKIHLLIGGSPCQNLSAAGNQKGLKGEQSSLFFEYLRIWGELGPTYFLLENVASMKKADSFKISDYLGVSPVMINSARLTAQNRKRYYWTNAPNLIMQPRDLGIILKDVLEDDVDEKYYLKNKLLEKLTELYPGQCNRCIKESASGVYANTRSNILKCRRRSKSYTSIMASSKDNTVCHQTSYFGKNKRADRIYDPAAKSVALDSVVLAVSQNTRIRKLTPTECERLQGLPDNYTEGVSNTQRYKMIGNGFTIPVIKYILREGGMVVV